MVCVNCRASIGPSGIEIITDVAEIGRRRGLQSDQVELKSNPAYPDATAAKRLQSDQVELKLFQDFDERVGAVVLQSDQVELKYMQASLATANVEASIGPSGIEINFSFRVAAAALMLQSDQVELKFLRVEVGRPRVGRFNRTKWN